MLHPEVIRFLQSERLQKMILAGLKDTINVHGPINQNLAPSAAKRIRGLFLSWVTSVEANYELKQLGKKDKEEESALHSRGEP